jgi:4-alpha-glucanotransferase
MNETRSSGTLLHVTSLPSPYGIGDFGPSAYDFAQFLADTGQSIWQILPLNPTTPGMGNSPYSSPSAFAGNSMLISPVVLVREGYLE